MSIHKTENATQQGEEVHNEGQAEEQPKEETAGDDDDQ